MEELLTFFLIYFKKVNILNGVGRIAIAELFLKKSISFARLNAEMNFIKIKKKKIKEMSEKKEIKCPFCGKTFNEADLVFTIEKDADTLLGWDWGIPRWRYYEISKCPNCKYRLMKEELSPQSFLKGMEGIEYRMR